MKKSHPKHLIAQRLFALFSALLILASILGAQQSPTAQAIQRGERIPILLFGVDAADASQHTDTLIVGILDPLNNFVNLLSLPRDTRIHWPGYRFRRVNEIYGYQLRKTGDPTSAATKVLEGVSYLLSSETASVSLPHFVRVDFSGFRKVVDLLGGVWVTVKIPMHYDDNAGNYHFHKEPGRYLMKGEEALHYVRFRGQTGDRGRIYRQQEFVRGMLKRMANPMAILRLPEMAAAIATGIHTNLSMWDMIYLASGLRRVRAQNVGFYIAPGRPVGAYWSIKKEAMSNLASVIFLGQAPFYMDEDTIVPQVGVITVKIWNASGKKGFGYKTAKFLRRNGFDVVDWGNFAVNQEQTRVVDRKGKIKNAQAVAAILGVDNCHSEPSAKALVDVEVIIGQNYTALPSASSHSR